MASKEEVFEYLEDLRDSGVTNMFGAAPYLERHFKLSPKRAGELLLAWMKSKEETK